MIVIFAYIFWQGTNIFTHNGYVQIKLAYSHRLLFYLTSVLTPTKIDNDFPLFHELYLNLFYSRNAADACVIKMNSAILVKARKR